MYGILCAYLSIDIKFVRYFSKNQQLSFFNSGTVVQTVVFPWQPYRGSYVPYFEPFKLVLSCRKRWTGSIILFLGYKTAKSTSTLSQNFGTMSNFQKKKLVQRFLN